jgi:hypothetical protein
MLPAQTHKPVKPERIRSGFFVAGPLHFLLPPVLFFLPFVKKQAEKKNTLQ